MCLRGVSYAPTRTSFDTPTHPATGVCFRGGPMIPHPLASLAHGYWLALASLVLGCSDPCALQPSCRALKLVACVMNTTSSLLTKVRETLDFAGICLVGSGSMLFMMLLMAWCFLDCTKADFDMQNSDAYFKMLNNQAQYHQNQFDRAHAHDPITM